MTQLSASVTGVTQPIEINVTTTHGQSTSTAVITCRSHTTAIGNALNVSLGYGGVNTRVFGGYVKRIEQKTPDGLYTITAQDKMVRAVEYYIVSNNPDTPLKYHNISAEALVRNLLALAGLTDYSYDTTHFTFGITNDVEVNVVSSYDFAKRVADILAYDLWCDEDGIAYFKDRRPYVMAADTAVATLDDTSLFNILSGTYTISDRDLRNKIVVYGYQGVYAEAHASSPYLPTGFYKTVIVASEWIDDQTVAQNSANYNLSKLNRLTKELSLEVIGNPLLKARETVHVDESITGRDEDWYIYSCEHRWSSSGYRCQLELRS